MRVSTEEQAQFGVSLEAQAERIAAYCQSQRIDLIEILRDEGDSGAKRIEKRAAGAELLRRLDSGEALHIVGLKLDRLFRDAEDCLKRTRRWDRAGIALHIIDMGGSNLNTRSPMGRMFLTIAAAFAELERNLIAERTSSALQHKKRAHKVYSPMPYGFDRDGDQLVDNPAEQAVIIRIRDWHGRRASLQWIADELNRSGVPTKKPGGSWHASTVRGILGNSIHRKEDKP